MQWLPNVGFPQMDAWECLADELFYGGEAGGGKTDLLLGIALNLHRRSLILRRLNGEVAGLVDRTEAILETSRGLKRNPPASYRTKDKLIAFGGCQFLKDREKYQGQPNDFIGFDEISNFLEEQYTFIIAWNRSTVPGQRSRVVVTGNPPTRPEGMWVVRRWAAWLDPNHPNPALPGELRWYTTIDGHDTEVDGPGPVMIDGRPYLDHKGQPILPKSRTFIPAELEQNPDLAETNYGATLAALPENLRKSMKEGDFAAGIQEDANQLIPGAWIDEAMGRWNEQGAQSPMTVISCDPAQGGPDDTVLLPRHGAWYNRLVVVPGKQTKDGPAVAALIVLHMRGGCEIILDMGGGYGGDTNTHLKHLDLLPTLYNGAAAAPGHRDRSGALKFANVRAAAHWHLRECLSPEFGSFMALPPDPELRADLTSLKWVVGLSGVVITPKDQIRDLLGRSPGRGDALVMANWAKGKTSGMRVGIGNMQRQAITSNRNPRRR